MKKTVDGRKYGFDGDFIIKEMNTGQWEDMTDELFASSTSVDDNGIVKQNPKPGAMMRILVKHGITESPVELTDANIRRFPIPLTNELSEAVGEVNGDTLPFGGMAIGKEMPKGKQGHSQ